MPDRKFRFHDGKKGAALAVRVKMGGVPNRFKKVLKDGTVVVQLKRGKRNPNQELLQFLADELEIAEDRFQIIAGQEGKNKLVSVLDMKPSDIQQVVLKRIS